MINQNSKQNKKYLSFVIRNWSLTLCIVFLMFFFSTHNVFASTISKPSNFLTLNTGLTGWWTFDGKDTIQNVADKSELGNNGIFMHIAATSSVLTRGKVGQAFKPADDIGQTTGDFVRLPSGAMQIGTGDFSFSAWVNYTMGPTPNVYGAVATSRQSGGSGKGFMLVYVNSSYLYLYVENTDDGRNSTVFYSSLTPGWHHIVGTFVQGTSVSLYVDGVLRDQDLTLIPSGDLTGTYPARIGDFAQYTAGDDRAVQNFPGYIDEVRTYSRALTQAEITQLYNMGAGMKIASSPRAGQTTGCTSGLSCGLVGYWTFDGPDMIQNVKDKSGQNNTGYLQGQVSTTTVLGKIGQGFRFDNQSSAGSSYVGTSANIIGVNDVTVCMWLYPISPMTSNNTYFLYDGSFQLYFTTNNRLALHGGGGGSSVISSNNAIQYNKWVHACATRTSAGIENGFIDGVHSGNTDVDNGTPVAGTVVSLGNRTSGGRAYGGIMDDVRIYNRVLSANEIQQLYNLGASSKVSISPRTNQTTGCSSGLSCGLVGYWTFDGNDMKTNVADKSGNGNNGYLSGFTSTTTVLGKIGQALSFDGVDDYINVGNNINESVGTVSIWIKPSTLSGSAHFFSGFGGRIYLIRSASDFQVSLGSLNGASTNKTIINNVWQHLVLVWDNGNYIPYYNGSAGTSGTYAAMDLVTSIHIGKYAGGSSFYYSGSIDDVRIYNRALSADEIKQLYNLGR